MKGLSKSIAAKIVAWILLAVFCVLFWFSVMSCLVMEFSNAYFDNGRTLRVNVLEKVFSFDRERIYAYVVAKIDGNNTKLNNYGYEDVYGDENSNLFFTVTDTEGNIIIESGTKRDYRAEFEYAQTVVFDKIHSETVSFENYSYAQEYFYDIASEHEIVYYDIVQIDGIWVVNIQYHRNEYKVINVNAYVSSYLNVKDRYYYSMRLVDFLVGARYGLIIFAVVVFIISVLLVVFLCYGAGHKKGDDEIKLTIIDKVPYDIYVAVCAILGLLLVSCSDTEIFILVAFIAVPVCLFLFFTCIVTLAVRVKTSKWYKNTFIFFLCNIVKKFVLLIFRAVKYLLKKLPLYFKAILVFFGISVIELIFIFFGIEDFIVLWFFERIVFAALTVYFVISLRKLQKAAAEMASGDLLYRADTRYMSPSLKNHAEDLNKICDGLSAAIAEKTKSEHMKAELITNVSHDIKTPLTSIINYTDLLKKEGLDSNNASEYLGVIEHQANRLKNLTEDIIEASKAITGCITVNAENTDINVLLSQAIGEYEDKFKENGLEAVINLFDGNPMIYADGSLLWRVFDNLFNNICKYSQSGTRVYIKSLVSGDDVRITFGNISKAPLDISSDELMERFVRGDASRNTEGSGLGLSIAQSLIELQGGTFDIKIDGDLFKAEIVFKKVEIS